MRTLLIVDDEMLIADGLREMLAKAFEGRLNVLCRYSAAGALQAAEEVPVDVLLTDINIPNMSGLELQRAVQAQADHLAITAGGGAAEVIQAQVQPPMGLVGA